MRILILAAAVGGVWYAHSRGFDLWTADGWTKLFGSTQPTQPGSPSPNAGMPNDSSPGPVLSPTDCGCGCSGAPGGCGASSVPATGSGTPISSKPNAADTGSL